MTNSTIRGPSTRSPRVLLDVDGVLADFIGEALAIANDLLGCAFRREHVHSFDFTTALGLTPYAAAAVKRRIGSTPGLARSLDVYPGAIAGVRRLRQIADVYIVTSPWNSNPTWTHDREVWLRRHFAIPSEKVIHTSAKHVCVGDVLVDDRTETCVAWRDAHPAGITVQWMTPHNRRDGWDGHSASSWDELVELVGSAGAR